MEPHFYDTAKLTKRAKSRCRKALVTREGDNSRGRSRCIYVVRLDPIHFARTSLLMLRPSKMAKSCSLDQFEYGLNQVHTVGAF